MAHCPFEELSDLSDVLTQLRRLGGITEKKPGIFYRKSQAALHFHVDGDHRYAHVKAGGIWQKVDIPFRATQAQRAAFLAKLRALLN